MLKDMSGHTMSRVTIHSKLFPSEKVNSSPVAVCLHCKAEMASESSVESFCCRGCEAAHSFITEMGLDQYYRMPQDLSMRFTAAKDRPPFIPQAATWVSESFIREFAIQKDGYISYRFFVQEIRCYACAWLIESTVKLKWSNVEVVKANVTTQSLDIRLGESTLPTLYEIEAVLSGLGYTLSPLQASQCIDSTSDWIRTGIAGFVAGNVMLLAFAEYLDGSNSLGSGYRVLFRSISALLTVFLLATSGWPILSNAIQSIRLKRPSIDFPLAFALVFGSLYSILQIANPTGDVYFDAITMIVFLISISRSLQSKMLSIARAKTEQVWNKMQQFVTVEDLAGIRHVINLSELRKGDTVHLNPTDMNPVDSVLLSESAYISLDSLTGEAKRKFLSKGQSLPAGAIVYEQPAKVLASESGTSGLIQRVQKIGCSLENSRSSSVLLSDRFANFFTLALISLSLLVLGWGAFSGEFQESLRRVAAMLIVACPCALAFAAPLCFASAQSTAVKQGFIFKDLQGAEKLKSVTTLFWDKTGTLSKTRPELIVSVHKHPTDLEWVSLLFDLSQLPSFSSHHAAKEVGEWAQTELTTLTSQDFTPGKSEIVDSKEIIGQGVLFRCRGRNYRVGRFEFGQHQKLQLLSREQIDIAVWQDEDLILSFERREKISTTAEKALLACKADGLDNVILSGDSGARVESLTSSLDPRAVDSILSEVTVLEKPKKISSLVTSSRKVPCMIGNGFNDSLAFRGAAVAIATHDAHESAKEAANVQLTSDDLCAVPRAIAMSKALVRRLSRLALGSSLYNSIAIAFAAMGYVHPVVAAVLMPASSLTVLALSTRRWK